MEEIKTGDYVKLKNGHAGYIYKVTCAEDDVPRICVDYKQNVFCTLAKDEVEKIDPKTAFLTELRELLAKYDAKITSRLYIDYNGKIGHQMLTEVGDDYIYYFDGFENDEVAITADNIMDFDKE